LNDHGPSVEYRGFVSGADKARLFRESDCLCFPTYYPAESFGLVLVEAMAFGLPVVTTRWRMIPELLPKDYPGIVEPRSPEQLANALLAAMKQGYDATQRQRFLKDFTVERFAENVRAAFRAEE
jgi:glycosyltransferase involved in cell wall biosynthesis